MSKGLRLLPLWLGGIHLVGASATSGTSTLWDVLIYNALLIGAALWSALGAEPLIASAIACWTLGSIFSAYSPWSGIGYLMFYPFLFFAILKSQQKKKLTKTQILDSLIITLGISSILTAVALTATSSAQSSFDFFLLTFYPIGDLLLIASLIVVGLRNGVSLDFFLLMSAIIIFTVSDLGYLGLISNDHYRVGGIVDEGWLLALALCATYRRGLQPNSRTLNTYPAIFLALGLSLSLLGWFSLKPQQNLEFALAPAITTLLLAFIRMALALEEAEQGKIHKELSVTDELTGVGNRREFFARLEALPLDGSWAVLLLDLDDFKEVNDLHGHSAGDYVLREVAHRFQAALPAESYLARLGGDEFAALVNREGESALQLAQRLQLALTTPIYVGELSLLLTVSVGTAALTTTENPLELADGQMYSAKRQRR